MISIPLVASTVAAQGRRSGVTPTSVAFTVPGSDLFPANMFHGRRALMGGTLARAWVAWTHTDGLRVLDIAHGGSSADPRAFVPALAAATRTAVTLPSSTRTAAQVAAAIVSALVADGIDAVAVGATVTISGVSVRDLVIPPAVDMTDEALRGMHGMQRDDWGDGAAEHTTNSDGGTDAVVWMNLGTLGAAGRISGAYAWCNTSGAPAVMRLVVGTGPAYSLTPGAITVIGEAEATSDAVTGFASITFPAIAVGASTQIWIGHATNTATAGLRYRPQSATPLGAGDVPASQDILVDTTRDPASTNVFGASVTPTVDAHYAVNSALGVIFELPNGSGRYPADGSLTALIGDHNPDVDHGTQFDAGPGILAGETTHQRNATLPWSDVIATEISRVLGDTASGEDCRAALYEWADTDHPSTTPAALIADLGRLGVTAGTGNRRFTLTIASPPDVSGPGLVGDWWSLGFNYTTSSGAPIATLTLPVFLDDVSGDSGWLDAWVDDRETWHDNIRGASEYALTAGTQEYRTRVAAGNNGMNTTDADDPWIDPMATDASDDSPSAIAIDTVTITRAGIVAA
jgi:hypothetical protein